MSDCFSQFIVDLAKYKYNNFPLETILVSYLRIKEVPVSVIAEEEKKEIVRELGWLFVDYKFNKLCLSKAEFLLELDKWFELNAKFLNKYTFSFPY